RPVAGRPVRVRAKRQRALEGVEREDARETIEVARRDAPGPGELAGIGGAALRRPLVGRVRQEEAGGGNRDERSFGAAVARRDERAQEIAIAPERLQPLEVARLREEALVER